MRRIISSALFLSLLATIAPPGSLAATDPAPAAARKTPLDYKAYDA